MSTATRSSGLLFVDSKDYHFVKIIAHGTLWNVSETVRQQFQFVADINFAHNSFSRNKNGHILRD